MKTKLLYKVTAKRTGITTSGEEGTYSTFEQIFSEPRNAINKSYKLRGLGYTDVTVWQAVSLDHPELDAEVSIND